MHVDWSVRNCDSVHDDMFGAPREKEYGGEYGPYLLPRYTRGTESTSTIYFVMSTWNPYNTVVMKSTLRLPPPPGGLQRPGDCNQDGGLDISDAVCLLGHLFLGSPAKLPCAGGTASDPGNRALLDSNGDGGVDLSDAVYDLTFLFSGGPPPRLGAECTRIVGCASKCGP
jgi:hypothetical protein